MKKIALTFGMVICGSFGVPTLILSIGLEDPVVFWRMFIFGSVCFCAGAACAVYRFLIAGRERKVNRLAALIGTQKRIPLDWMAQRLNCSREKLIQDLRKTISWGYFRDAHIDEKNGYLLFPNLKVGALETRVCPNCGAGVEVMIGYYANCPYCGTVLETTEGDVPGR